MSEDRLYGLTIIYIDSSILRSNFVAQAREIK